MYFMYCTHLSKKITVGLSILFASSRIDDKIETVLEPIEAKQSKVDIGLD